MNLLKSAYLFAICCEVCRILNKTILKYKQYIRKSYEPHRNKRKRNKVMKTPVYLIMSKFIVSYMIIHKANI